MGRYQGEYGRGKASKRADSQKMGLKKEAREERDCKRSSA